MALALQTGPVGFIVPMQYKPDLVSILVVWAGLRLGFFSGLVFALCAGTLVDQISDCPTGLFAFVYSLVFVGCCYARATVQIDGPMGQAVMAFGATVTAGVLVLLTRWIGGHPGFGWQVISWIIAKSGLTAVSAALLIPIVGRVHWAYLRLVGGPHDDGAFG